MHEDGFGLNQFSGQIGFGDECNKFRGDIEYFVQSLDSSEDNEGYFRTVALIPVVQFPEDIGGCNEPASMFVGVSESAS